MYEQQEMINQKLSNTSANKTVSQLLAAIVMTYLGCTKTRPNKSRLPTVTPSLTPGNVSHQTK